MTHLYLYDDFILETLKSDDIDIVEKKLDKFFKSYGYNKRIDFGTNTRLPFYQISTDRNYLRREIKELSNPTEDLIDIYNRHNMDINQSLERYKKQLEEHKKGDIYIFTSPSKKLTPQLVDEFLHMIESMGYFVATSGSFEKKLKDKTKIKEHILKHKEISVSIEPYYDKEVEFDGEYLYHVTPKSNLEKIMKVGLNPKSKNTVSFYPARIYLAPDEKIMNWILPQLKEKKKDEEYVKLRVKNFPGLKLYHDVRFKSGFYTYNSINPKYIEVI